jgi:hypothetical protein
VGIEVGVFLFIIVGKIKQWDIELCKGLRLHKYILWVIFELKMFVNLMEG